MHFGLTAYKIHLIFSLQTHQKSGFELQFAYLQKIYWSSYFSNTNNAFVLHKYKLFFPFD